MENEKREKYSDKYGEKKPNLSTIIAAKVIKTLSKCKNINYDRAVEMVTALCEIVDNYMKEEKAKFEELTSDNEKHADDDKLSEAVEKVDRLFHALSKAELCLAKFEGREVSISYIRRLAKRVAFSVFRNVDGIDLKSIESDVKRSTDGRYDVCIIVDRK